MIRPPAAESRLPVGSSARMSPGRVASARATATFCCSPPESRLARVEARAWRPTSSSSLLARSFRSAGVAPASTSGSATFSSADIAGTRLKVWKMVLTRWSR